nr:unnamed protein product [Timema californicum]
MFGPFLGAYGSENIGRKLTMLLIAAPWTLSWVLVAAAPETITIFLGWFTQGLSFGAFFAVLPSYVGEISQENIRGILGSMSQIFITFGLLSQYCIGPWVSYHVLTIGCVFVPIVFVILFVFMPESPYFYFSKKRNEYAHKSLKWLRGHDDVNRELELIQDAVEEEMKNRGTYKDLFGNRVNLRALIIVAGCKLAPKHHETRRQNYKNCADHLTRCSHLVTVSFTGQAVSTLHNWQPTLGCGVHHQGHSLADTFGAYEQPYWWN